MNISSRFAAASEIMSRAFDVFFEDVTEKVNEGRAVDVVDMDFMV